MQALLSDGGSPEEAREDRRHSDAGGAQSGDAVQEPGVEAACDTALQQQQLPRQICTQQPIELQPPVASSQPQNQEALSTLNIHPAWLPLLQRAPPTALLVQSALFVLLAPISVSFCFGWVYVTCLQSPDRTSTLKLSSLC